MQHLLRLGHRTSSTASDLHAILSSIGDIGTACEVCKGMVCSDSKEALVSEIRDSAEPPHLFFTYRIIQKVAVTTKHRHITEL